MRSAAQPAWRGAVTANEPDDLVIGLRAGDPAAYDELVRLHGPRMLAVARRLMREEEEARDAHQDALVRVLESVEGFSGRSLLSTWLYRVVVNSCLMRLRARRRRREVPLADLPAGGLGPADSSWDPTDSILRRQRRRILRKCIEQLPEAYRTVLVLRDLEELDTRETACLLSTTRNAVKIRLHRAHRAVAELVHEDLARSAPRE